MNFAKDFFKTWALALVSGSPERLFKKLIAEPRSERLEQLWLALSSLSFALGFLVYILLPFCSPVLAIFSRLSNGNEPPAWIFWLSESHWIGLFLGLMIGFCLRLIFRFSGLSFLVAGGFLLTGIMSMSVAWGVFLGDFILGALERGLRFRQRQFRLRAGISLAFGLGGLLLTPLIQALITDLLLAAYSAQLRWLQWAALVFTFLATETITSLLFFHFYHAQSKKLTKV